MQSTPSYVVEYKATSKHGENEEATVVSPVADVTEILERDGFLHITILSSKVIR